MLNFEGWDRCALSFYEFKMIEFLNSTFISITAAPAPPRIQYPAVLRCRNKS